MIIFGVGDRRLQNLADILRDTPAGKCKLGERRAGVHAPDRLSDQVEFAWAGAKGARICLCFIVGETALRGTFSHDQVLLAFLSAAWP